MKKDGDSDGAEEELSLDELAEPTFLQVMTPGKHSSFFYESLLWTVGAVAITAFGAHDIYDTYTNGSNYRALMYGVGLVKLSGGFSLSVLMLDALPRFYGGTKRQYQRNNAHCLFFFS